MTKRKIGKILAISLAVAAAAAMPLAASAHGWDHDGGWHHGWNGGGYYHHGGGGYWHNGHWVAGAIITGAVAGLVGSALSGPAYYEPPVVYTRPTVVYEDAPYVTRRVVTRTVIYNDGYPTRYIRGDDDDGD